MLWLTIFSRFPSLMRRRQGGGVGGGELPVGGLCAGYEGLGKLFECSPIFDAAFYRRTYADAAHLSDADARAHWATKGFGAGRRAHAGPRITKVVLMTKDEFPLVRAWVLHHAHIFGPRNVYVIDSSAAGGPAALFLADAARAGVNVFQTQLNLNDLRAAINGLFRALAPTADFLIKLDTDELLLRSDGTTMHTTGLIEYLDEYPVTGALLKVAGGGENYPPEDCAAGGGNVVVASRRFHLVSAHPDMGRKFFAAPSYSDVDLGAHAGRVLPPFDALPSVFVTNLSYAHFHSACFDNVVENSLRALVSHGYVDLADSKSVMREKLAQRVATSNFPHGSIHKGVAYLAFLNDEAGERAKYEAYAREGRSAGTFIPAIAALAECLSAAFDARTPGYNMAATGCV